MYQFIHIEVYAKKVSGKAISRRSATGSKGTTGSGSKSLLNVRQVVAEAKREKGACPHVTSPQRPTHVYGVDLDEVERMATQSAEGKTDKSGRKLRADTPILLAGVAGYSIDEAFVSPERFQAWCKDTVDWLKQEYGDNLMNVTMHLDETHPHLHFYAVSETGRAKDLNAGFLAEKNCGSTDSKVRKAAYQKGMRDFQDRYYMGVGSKHGMLRIGPGRQRLSRKEHNAKKAEAELLEAKIREVRDMERQASQNIAQEHAAMLIRAESDASEKAAAVLDEAMKEASTEGKSLIAAAKNLVAKMIADAKADIQRMQQEALQWSRNAFENMRKLKTAEFKVESLTRELADKNAQLEYFVEENRDLQRRLKSTISIGGD